MKTIPATPKMPFEIAFARNRGKARQSEPNQDSVAVLAPGWFNRRPPLLLLADGMGGYNGGEIASRMVLETLSKAYLKSKPGLDEVTFLKEAAVQAHQKVQAHGQRSATLNRMGSTLVAGILTPHKISLVNVGDSRAYLVNAESIRQISYDHSVVAEALRQGLLTAEEAQNSPNRNRLTMSISAQRGEITPYGVEEALQPADVVFFCSDGVWSVITEPILRELIFRLPPLEACKKVITLANSLGGPDNISVVIARQQPPPPLEPAGEDGGG